MLSRVTRRTFLSSFAPPTSAWRKVITPGLRGYMEGPAAAMYSIEDGFHCLGELSGLPVDQVSQMPAACVTSNFPQSDYKSLPVSE